MSADATNRTRCPNCGSANPKCCQPLPVYRAMRADQTEVDPTIEDLIDAIWRCGYRTSIRTDHHRLSTSYILEVYRSKDGKDYHDFYGHSLLSLLTDAHKVTSRPDRKYPYRWSVASVNYSGPAMTGILDDPLDEPRPQCGDCGHPMTIVRPGKYQCDFCEADEVIELLMKENADLKAKLEPSAREEHTSDDHSPACS